MSSIEHRGGAAASNADFLSGGGELGSLMRKMDWSRTPLGSPAQWPQALRTAVRIMLTSRQPMFVWWGDELINLYNDAYKAIVGGKHPQALGQPAAVVWREIWDQVGPRARSAMFKNEGTYDESLLLIMERHGYPEETYYTFSYSPVPNDEGGTGGIFCANTDDTQRIVGERQLALLRDLAARTADARTLQAACELSAECLSANPRDLPFALIYLLDHDHRCVVLAGAAGVARGAPLAPEISSLRGESIWPFGEVLRTSSPCLIAPLGNSLGPLPTGPWAQPPVQAVAYPIPPSGQTGRAGVLIAGLNPYRLFDDSYQGFLGLVTRQIAAAFANAQAYEEERRRAEALAEIDRAKTAFFSNVSHEFRTPLTLILGTLEEVLSAPPEQVPEDCRALVDVSHRNALRLLRLVNSLLDFSRIEAGRAQAHYEPTDLATLTTDLASSFRSVMEKARLRFVVDCPPLGKPVYVDRDMWEKVVLNLVSNAFKFTFQGEVSVRLRAAPDGKAVQLTVEDTGTGIAAEELPRLFERFHRVAGAQGRTYEGTGIGLALVQELVQLHGGTVSVSSEKGRGSVFTVRIPFGIAHLPRERVSLGSSAARPAAAQAFVEEARRWLPADGQGAPAGLPLGPANPALAVVPGSGDGTGGDARPKVLLVDDNADMREYVQRLLEGRYAVKAVTDGERALEEALQDPPDLVLSDVMMPVLDGFGLLAALRAHPRTATLPVILLSARAGEDARIEGLHAGADDYLVKPFTARELLARVQTHIELARLRRSAEQNIRAAEERLRLAVESADLGTWDHDQMSGSWTCSGRCRTILGIASDADLDYNTFLSLIHPDDRKHALEVHQAALNPNGSGEYEGEWRMVRPDGSIRWVLYKGKALFETTSQGEKPIRVVGTMLDLTDRKRSEESLRETQKLESLGLLAGGIAHDFNNLLTGVIGNASLLEGEFPEGSPLAESARSLVDAADRMAALTGQMLAFSGRGRFRIQQLDLSQQVVQIIHLIQASIPKLVDLRLNLDEHLPAIEADGSQLQQVVMNLVINAAEAIHDRAGVVEIQTALRTVGEPEIRANATRQEAKPGEYVMLSVADTGCGMDEATLARIFDPFFTTKFTGRGLGLAAVLGIVRGHHGLLTVDSRPGSGTTMRVYFPVGDKPTAYAAMADPAEAEDSGTVLIVDDEEVVRATAKVVLSRLGYRVLLARNGEEALQVFSAQSGEIDVVLLDMTMPVMGGEQTLPGLVRLRPEITVLGSSGFDEREAQQRFGERIDGFLQKPYTAAQLRHAIVKIRNRKC